MARRFTSSSSQYIGLSGGTDPGRIHLSYPFTVSLWFRPRSISSFQLLWIMTDDVSDGTNLDTTGIFIFDDNKVSARDQCGGAGDAKTTSTVSANTWYHTCGVFTSNASRTIYFNGSSEATDTTSITHNWGGSTATRIGGGLWIPSAPFYSDCDIAEVGTYSDDLSAAEIATLAAGYSPLMVRRDVLTSYHKLLDADSDRDWFGGYDMTASGSPTYAQHPPIIYPSSPRIRRGAAAAGPSYTIPRIMHHLRQQGAA